MQKEYVGGWQWGEDSVATLTPEMGDGEPTVKVIVRLGNRTLSPTPVRYEMMAISPESP